VVDFLSTFLSGFFALVGVYIGHFFESRRTKELTKFSIIGGLTEHKLKVFQEINEKTMDLVSRFREYAANPKMGSDEEFRRNLEIPFREWERKLLSYTLWLGKGESKIWTLRGILLQFHINIHNERFGIKYGPGLQIPEDYDKLNNAVVDLIVWMRNELGLSSQEEIIRDILKQDSR